MTLFKMHKCIEKIYNLWSFFQEELQVDESDVARVKRTPGKVQYI
jgi:hypothetical protein